MMNSRRRTGAEGERVHLATLFVNLKQSAAEVLEVPFVFKNKAPFANWLGIYYQDSLNSEKLPITSQVGPLTVIGGALKIQAPPNRILTTRGDANLDKQTDTTDTILVLEYLFLGGAEPTCYVAADFDLSGELDISDPINLLRSVYLSDPPFDTLDPAEVPCN
jgi:hypothetical protein